MKEIDLIVVRSPVEMEVMKAEGLVRMRLAMDLRFFAIVDGLMVVEGDVDDNGEAG